MSGSAVSIAMKHGAVSTTIGPLSADENCQAAGLRGLLLRGDSGPGVSAADAPLLRLLFHHGQLGSQLRGHGLSGIDATLGRPSILLFSGKRY